MADHTERQVQVQLGTAFFRAKSQPVRDLGILAATVHRQHTQRLRVLDAMAGCGIRSLRYWTESGADWLWVNDSNPELATVLHENLSKAIAQGCAQITHQDANRIFFDCYTRQDYYDLVDVDCFGSAAPFLSTSLWSVAIGGLLYLTSTDGRTVGGSPPEQGLLAYGSFVRNHPAVHEQGLRLLIGSTQQQAATKGLGITPIFSLFTGQTYRVMVQLQAKPKLTAKNYGFLGYCHRCGSYQCIDWRKIGRSPCPNDDHPLTLSGPMWLGYLHDVDYLTEMLSLANDWHWPDCSALLNIMLAEATMPPYFYPLAEIGRRGQMDIPKRSHLLQALHQAGYPASETHLTAQGIKTHANLPTCIQLAHQIAHHHDDKG